MLNPEPVVRKMVGCGSGVAHCHTLGLLVFSLASDNTLRVFSSPRLGREQEEGFMYQCTLGGAKSLAPMQFSFHNCYSSGYLAFTGCAATGRYLVVTDAGLHAVHVIDVVHKAHVGYVAAPLSICFPMALAARKSQVAVIAQKHYASDIRIIRLFEGSGAVWTVVREMSSTYWFGARGLRFTADGTNLVVANPWVGRVSLYRSDGSFVRHVVKGLGYPLDVEEWDNGWLVVCGEPSPVFVHGDGDGTVRPSTHTFATRKSMAVVRGVGVVVREHDGRVSVFATYDAIAMGAMSAGRVVWMMAVARGIQKYSHCSTG